ncbi:MAG TPA: GAF domain-containing protein [Anaerolineae bacterium]|nr:GAF domain-containing protein [Anaerolineae bacterium]
MSQEKVAMYRKDFSQAAAQDPDLSLRRTRTKRLLAVLVVGAVVALALHTLFFPHIQLEPGLAVVGGLAVTLAGAAFAYYQTRRGKLDAAGYSILVGLAAAFLSNELVWAGATLALTLGGILALLLAGSLALPGRWRARLIAAGLFVAGVWLINQFAPLPRYDTTQVAPLTLLIQALTAALILATFVRIIHVFRAGSIRTRLSVMFVAMGLLPVVIIIVAAVLAGIVGGRQSAVDQLESVAILKEEAIKTWLATLKGDLSTVLNGVNASGQAPTVFRAAPGTDAYNLAATQVTDWFSQMVEQTGRFDELFLVNLRGNIILSTDSRQMGKIEGNRTYFREALRGPYVQPPLYVLSLGGWSIVIARPVLDSDGGVIGVLAGRASLATLSEVMQQTAGLGESGKTFLISASNNALLTEPLDVVSGFTPGTPIRSQGANAAVASKREGFDLYTNHRGLPVLGVYRWIPELQAALLAEQDQVEVFGPINSTITFNLAVAALTALAAVAAALFIARGIANPLSQLVRTARRIAGGDLELTAAVERNDEVGAVAEAFNSMTLQLRGLIDSLELRVEARTAQLQASADVGRAAASILDPDQLLRAIANLITERFGFYYVAVFTLDRDSRFAVLREATGEAGQALKASGYRLEISGESMVGAAILTHKPQIAPDADSGPAPADSSLLPDTRSEIALPLVAGGRLFGALDVQSTQAAAFDETSAAALQMMADQIAIALNNAQSYTEAQAAAQRARALYVASQQVGRLEVDLSATLADMLRTVSETLGYAYWQVITFDERREWLTALASSQTGQLQPLRPADHLSDPVVRSAVYGESHLINDPHASAGAGNRQVLLKLLSVPLISREAPIGALSVGRAAAALDLAEGDLEVARSVASLAAIAIENRTLFEQTRRALGELDAVNRRLTGEAWGGFTRRLSKDGIIWMSGGNAANQQHYPEITKALSTGLVSVQPLAEGGQLGIAIPVALRGVPIGALRLTLPEQRWTSEMAATLESIAGHVAQAAENARLVETAEERARRERALTELTDKIRSKADVERILQTAAEELARHLRASRVAVRLDAERESGNGEGQVEHRASGAEVGGGDGREAQT